MIIWSRKFKKKSDSAQIVNSVTADQITVVKSLNNTLNSADSGRFLEFFSADIFQISADLELSSKFDAILGPCRVFECEFEEEKNSKTDLFPMRAKGVFA